MSVPGPDVLTSCGAYRRVLSLGVEYMAGIGGACNPISAWQNTSTYSSSELQLLRDLQTGCAMNPMSSVCSGTSPVAVYMGMGLVTLLLAAATTVVVGFY